MRSFDFLRRVSLVLVLVAGLALVSAAPAFAAGDDDAAAADQTTISSIFTDVINWLTSAVTNPDEGDLGPSADPSG